MHRLVEGVLSPSTHGTSAKGHAKGQVEEGTGHVSLFCRRRLADGCCFMRVQVTEYASASSGRRAPYSASQFCAYWGVPRSTFVNSARHFSTPLVLCAVMSLSQFCTAIPSPGTTVAVLALTCGRFGDHRGRGCQELRVSSDRGITGAVQAMRADAGVWPVGVEIAPYLFSVRYSADFA